MLFLDGEQLLPALDAMVGDARNDGVFLARQDRDPLISHEPVQVVDHLPLAVPDGAVAVQLGGNLAVVPMKITSVVGETPEADVGEANGVG